MRQFKIGIIGYGGFGKFLHNAWKSQEQIHVMAIADANAEMMSACEDVSCFTDWRELLRQPDIDVVAIVTEPGTHREIANACMQAGKHVFIEKPLATSPADASNILQTRDACGRVASIDFMMRFNPLVQALKQFTQTGIFGKLRRADIENYAQDEQLPPEHWFWDTRRSGGILIEHAVHFIDLIHYLSPAKVLKVNGLKHNRNVVQEDQVMANVLYEGGLIATHYHAFSRPGFFETTRIKLAYDLADIELEGWIPLGGTFKALVNPETKAAVLNCPFFEPAECTSVHEMEDDSRPKGWGLRGLTADRNRIRSGGISYQVDEILTGKFKLNQSKQEVYAASVRASLLDLLHKIEDSAHQLQAPLETGLESLEVAVRATAAARQVVNQLSM